MTRKYNPDVVTVTDRQSGDYATVSGGSFSINGTEPMKIPDELRGLTPLEIAREMLKRHLSKNAV